MSTGKRFERLGWQSLEQVGIDVSSKGLQFTLSLAPKSIYDIARNKSDRVVDQSLVSILYFALEDESNCRAHALATIQATQEFFLGPWRSQAYALEDGTTAKEDSLRQQFNWISAFEAALLWASVLDEWEFLARLGTFPKPDSHVESIYGVQCRDLYVAMGAFLSNVPQSDLKGLLERASAGPKKLYKLSARLIRSCLSRDPAMLQKTLVEYLKYYKKSEFPKNLITKKISAEATFFVHWAKKEKLPLTVPAEFEDHIVRLK